MKIKYIIIYIFFILFLLYPSRGGKNYRNTQPEKFNIDIESATTSNISETIKTSLSDYFNGLVKGGFNGVILVAKGGDIVFKKAHGWANYRKQDSLDIHSSFQIASVTKQFTAAAILKLQQMGKLDLEDTVTHYIPKLPYKDITIYQLLTHQSGLMNYMYFCDDVLDKKETITNAEVIDLLQKHKPNPYYQPDRHFDYSNTGYMLLARIIENVSGITYTEFLNTHFFEPLNMDDSFVYDPISSGLKNKTVGYHYKWLKANTSYLDGVYGDKGVYSSAADLYKWDRALYTNKILNENGRQKAFSPQVKIPYTDKSYGFGWRIRHITNESNFNRTKIIYHAGWWNGYNSLFVRIPKIQGVIIILTNELSRSFLNSYPHLVNALLPSHTPSPLS